MSKELESAKNALQATEHELGNLSTGEIDPAKPTVLQLQYRRTLLINIIERLEK